MIKSRFFLFLLLAVLQLPDELFAQTISFTGAELLGCPTNKSVAINIVPDEDIELYYEYGTSPGLYTEQTSSTFATGNQPHEIVIGGLSANTRYYYRMQYRISGGSWVMRDEHSFETQRAESTPYKFTITSDSHAQFNTTHQQTMVNVKNDIPDFNIDLGDTFIPDGATSQSTVNNKYLAYRNPLYMGAIGPSVPIFLSSGNHEDEEGWNFDDLFSIALASVQARKAYYPTPIPSEFYSGNDDLLSSINESTYGDQYREDYYAWTWGDALFVVIDPFQYTMNLPYAPGAAGEGTDDPQDGDQWSWTLGKKQFSWFKQTIQNSNARYKFVFSHQMTGGIPNLTIAGVGPGYVRGGAGAAPYFEWGGKNADGSEGFSSHRSAADFGTTPIHQLMVQNGVSAYFHGHDHQYVYESLDGIVYQEVPSPSMTGSGFSGIYNESNPFTHKILPNAGHLRVSITTTEATVDYVQSNGNVAYSYVIYPNTGNQPGITLTSPNGGENWEVNSIHNITWTTTGSVGNIHIEYSINNGGTWSDVVASTENSGSYTWTVPDSPSTNCIVRVSETGGSISDVSNTKFTISCNSPVQPGTITGNTPVCQGSSQTYSISPVTGATSYAWTLPSGWSGSSTSASITATAGAAGGTISVTANNSCGSSNARTLAVSVTALVTQPGSITGSTTVCQGSSETYSISPVTGATSYTWTLPSGWSGTSTSASITATAGAAGGTISVTANNSCGSSTPRTLAVSVTAPVTQPGSITGSTTVCQGSSETYSISPVTGATSYTWTLPSGWSGSSTSASITATAGAAGGTISVTANNSCGSSTARTLAVTVTALVTQPGSITGSTTVCQGSSQTYSISPVTGATSYTWTLPSGWSGSSTSASITATAGAAGGTISVTANNSCGSSNARTLAVTVTALVTQPGSITGSTTVCQGSSQTYSISPVTGATSYTWTLPSGWSGSSTSASITATAGAAGGTISVTANNSCGSSTARTLAVTVTALVTQPGSISGSTTVCQGSSQTYSISPVTGATSYTWTLPSGWSGSSTSASITATAGAAGGTISVTANNSCGSSNARTLAVSVTALVTQPGSITGSTTVCQGSSQTYSISPVTGATSYTWTLPSGWSGSSTSASITATAGAAGGTISVTANNSCGSSNARTLAVSVTALVTQPGSITGSTTVCQGSSQTYSISPVTGATSYTWTLPSGWSGSSISESITATAGAAGGTISVTAINSCGSGTPRTLSVAISSKPIVTTMSEIRDSTSSIIISGGTAINDNGSEITSRGVCWSTNTNPTIDLNTKTVDGTGTGAFKSIITGLVDGITYHIRAYSTNCAGTGYGSEIQYTLTGIEYIQTAKILIFPNPVFNFLNIEYKNEDYKTINIFNSSGRLIGKAKAVTPSQQLDFSVFEQGFYILEFVRQSGEQEQFKVIKK